MVAKNKQ